MTGFIKGRSKHRPIPRWSAEYFVSIIVNLDSYGYCIVRSLPTGDDTIYDTDMEGQNWMIDKLSSVRGWCDLSRLGFKINPTTKGFMLPMKDRKFLKDLIKKDREFLKKASRGIYR